MSMFPIVKRWWARLDSNQGPKDYESPGECLTSCFYTVQALTACAGTCPAASQWRHRRGTRPANAKSCPQLAGNGAPCSSGSIHWGQYTHKRSWRVLVTLALAPCLAHAAGGDWTSADTARQAAFTAFAAIDWAQTRYIAQHGEFYETNPALGRHPSTSRVDAYFAATIAGHAAISYVLPPAWRHGWQYVWIGIEFDKTYHNHSIGIHLSF